VAQARSTGHHRLTHEIVAAVANMAYERPVHEVFDWVRPILLEDDWTDAAAICAAWGVSADVVRGAHPGDGPIGGVPERFLAHPVVLSRHASVQINAFGRWKEALALLDGFTSGSGSPGVELERSWVTAQCLRQFGGGPGAEIDDGEWLVIGRRAEAAVATARTTGDDLLLGSQAYRVAMMLTARDPERALQLADEALEIGVRLNARTLIDHARSARLSAVSRIVAAHPNQVRTLAGEMRDSIVAALDGGNRRVLILTIVNAASLLMPADAASVYTYLAVLRTRWNADSIGHLTPPDGWPAWDQRATTVSHDDAVRAIVAALDRLIAAEAEAPAAEGGDT
jgi:hypothetical protein